MQVRAKFTVERAERGGDDSNGYVQVQARPVYGDSEDNKSWSRWTPNGSLQMTITNPAVFDAFEVGKEYFIDITPAS